MIRNTVWDTEIADTTRMVRLHGNSDTSRFSDEQLHGFREVAERVAAHPALAVTFDDAMLAIMDAANAELDRP